METKEGDKDMLASKLQDELVKFAALEKEGREKALPGLADLVMETADSAVVERLVDTEMQATLQEAVDETNELSFKKFDGTIVEKPWSGEHTIILLGEDGKLAAGVSADGYVSAKYGDLYKYAVIKALCQMHLQKAGVQGDLADNFEYFVGLGLKPGENFFSGSSAVQAEVGDKKFTVASSGCALNRDYLRDLLLLTPDILENETDRSDFDRLFGKFIDSQAGRSEAVFCDLTVERIEGPKPKLIAEPKKFRDLRVNN